MSTIVFDSYWRFAALRQEIFFKKLTGAQPPFAEDPILQKHKFTNAYRASDRVSQFLIKNVIYVNSQNFENTFFKTILFKIFNKIDTWKLLSDELGEINIANFDFDKCSKVLTEAMKAGEAVYSGAYIMASGKSSFGYNRKFDNHLRLVQLMLKENLPQQILEAKSLEQIFEMLRSYPSIGNFLAFQYAIDLNYSSYLPFSEMDYVMPGPGAKDGIRKCFSDYGDYNEMDIIKYVTDRQEFEFERLGIEFKDLWGRPLQLIDCQNLFCETDKYARVKHPEIGGLSDRKRIKQLYIPDPEPLEVWFPPKWGINEIIKKENGKREKRIHKSLP